MHVLIIEDDLGVSEFVALMLTRAKLTATSTPLGREGLELAKLHDFDLILLDLTLPDMHGHDVLLQIREAGIQVPVLILSGANDAANKVKGFELGADDYLTKPFVREELFARIHAVTRRSRGDKKSIIRIGKVEVDLEDKIVRVEGKAVDLTFKEYEMLELLSMHKGKTLTKRAFLNHLYSGMNVPAVKIIDVFICKLRQKLSIATGGDTVIETVWGQGYILHEPIKLE